MLKTKFYHIEKNRAAGLAFSITVAIYLIVALVFSAISLNLSAEQKAESVYLYLSFFIPVPVVIVSAIVFFETTGYNAHDFLSFKVMPKNLLPAALIFIGAYLALGKVNDYVVAFFESFGYKDQTVTLPDFNVFDYIECIVVICILPAIMEETLFRGIVLGGIKRGGVAAIVSSALVFALYHMSPSKTVYQFLMGVIFAVVFMKTDSFLLTAFIHFLNNFAVVTFNYFPPAFLTDAAIAPYIIIGGVLTAALGFLLLFAFNKDKKIIQTKPKSADNKVIGGFFVYASAGIAACAVMWIAGFLK